MGSIRVLLILAALLAASLPITARAWWNDDWSYRKQIAYDISLNSDAAALAEGGVLVPVRLHAGNFGFFEDVMGDARDLRFIAADDKTPLDHVIERWDPISGLALVWVRLTVPGPRPDLGQFWMYYGNKNASLLPRAAVYKPPTVAVYHFVEPDGPPRDSSGLGNDAVASTAIAAAGALDLGLEFASDSYVTLPASPLIALDTVRGLTIALWLRPSSGAAPGLLFSQGGESGNLEVRVSGDSLMARIASADAAATVEAPLVPDTWQHVVIAVGGELRLFIDGRLAGSAPVPRLELSGAGRLGARQDRAAFIGRIDELQMHAEARPAEWARLAAAVQAPDGEYLRYGDDETRDTGAGVVAELGLLYDLFGRMGASGWLVIALIVLLGIASADVMVVKLMSLRRMARSDQAFRAGLNAAWPEDIGAIGSHQLTPASADDRVRTSIGLARVYNAALRELATIAADPPSTATASCLARPRTARISAQDLEVVRAALDATVVEESHRLNRRLVLMTLAVSGGPFLGLLGTVIGVMLTFAAIAKSGDVNVNTIAPGVASALMTTVAGLLIAIPSMFGYNIVATRILTRVAELEVFADQLIGRIGATHGSANTREVSDAA